MGGFAGNPFLELPLFRKTRDGRYVVALDFYPRSKTDTLKFLRCTDSLASIENAILQWRADDLEAAAAEEGLVLAKVRTTDEFLNEPQYTEVLSTMPLITVEKIGESEPMPFKKDGKNPLDGIRAFGMGHVIAGGAMGRDLAMYGADVLNIWRPNATEVEAFAWDVQVGMRSTILDSSKEDRAKFDNLLKDADVFFANKRPGYLERNGLTAEELCATKPGLIHAKVVLHGDTGPWSNRPGFDEIGAAVSGVFCIEGTPTFPEIACDCSHLRQRGGLARNGRHTRGAAPARDGGWQLSSRRVSDPNRAMAAFAWDFRQGVCRGYGRIERRAHVCRSRSVYCGDAAWHLPGNDRPGGHVANERVIPNGLGAARFIEAAMAGTVKRKGVRAGSL